jgi:hypothetical protein
VPKHLIVAKVSYNNLSVASALSRCFLHFAQRTRTADEFSDCNSVDAVIRTVRLAHHQYVLKVALYSDSPTRLSQVRS